MTKKSKNAHQQSFFLMSVPGHVMYTVYSCSSDQYRTTTTFYHYFWHLFNLPIFRRILPG